MDEFVCPECKSAPEQSPIVSARFQRNSDGQFVGRMTLNGEVLECWLVFDGGVENPAFLKLSFEEPKSFG